MPDYTEIVLPLPVNKIFHYRVPDKFQEYLKTGMRVLVNFRNKLETGYCVGFVPQPEVAFVKDIEKIIDAEPMFDEKMLALTRWISEYYFCSWGQALEAALPSGVRKQIFTQTIAFIQLAQPPEKIKSALTELKPGQSQQKRILKFFLDLPVPPVAGDEPSIPYQQLLNKLGISSSPVESLRRKKLIKIFRQRSEIDPFLDEIIFKTPLFTPTEEQSAALELIKQSIDRKISEVILLHGITGSGKTEVYLQSIQYLAGQNKQAIMLVPEISLTPQTVRRFRERFDRIAVLHSHLTEGHRAEQWRQIKSGQAQIIIGARSAIFAPTPNLGLIILDEEHEPSFKQQNTPLYHAREVAIKRAEIEKAVVILGSATPSLETYYQSLQSQYKKITLPYRIEKRPLPPVEIIDLAKEISPKNPFPVFSKKLELAIRDTIKNKEQVILFLNRRGFATLIICPRCRSILRCRHCQVSLTYHKQRQQGICHYCQKDYEIPKFCPECARGRLKHLGMGTEKVEEYTRQLFNSYTIDRMDSDAMKTRHSYHQSLTGLWSGQTDILIGTQMIAKGLDVPNVTLVGVVSGDTALYLKDFRSSERTFQLITQVAGRTGRGPKGGRVLVQTFNPTHYSIMHAAKHDYESFAKDELSYRQELHYPPFGRMLRILVESKKMDKLDKLMHKLSLKIEDFFKNQPGGEILGPAPAPMAKVKEKHRWHLIIKTKELPTLQALIKKIAADLHPFQSGVNITVDMDPVSLL
ncbi:MAG: primosomal protein N' [Planctomycetota bacterium]